MPYVSCSVADPEPDPQDPYVFGPPGYGSGSSMRYRTDPDPAPDPSIIKRVLVIHSEHDTHHVTPTQQWINVNSPLPDPALDPGIFVSGLQDDKLKIIFSLSFFANYNAF